MPAPRHEFYFRAVAKGKYDAIEWLKPLVLLQCAVVGAECNEWVDIGLPYCPKHLREVLGVEIRPSKRKGKGVFATRDHPTGTLVLPCISEHISRKELDHRYGDYTAPYAIGEKGSTHVDDGALMRGIGCMVNHGGKKSQCDFIKPSSSGKWKNTWKVRNVRGPIRAGEEVRVDYGEAYELDEPGVEFDTVATRGRARTETHQVLRAEKREMKRTGRGEYEHLKLRDAIPNDSDVEDITDLMPKGSHARKVVKADDHDYGTLHTFHGPYHLSTYGEVQFPEQDEAHIKTVIEHSDITWHGVKMKEVMLRLAGLKDNGWFHDEIFTVYRLVKPAHRVTLLSSFLYELWSNNNLDATRRLWTEQTKDAKSVLAIPVHLNSNHWAMVIVDDSRIIYHDSMSTGRANEVTTKVEAMLIALKGGKYTRYVARDTPQQTNGNDCGAYALLVAYALNIGDDYRIRKDRDRADLITRFRRFLIAQFAIHSHADTKVVAAAPRKTPSPPPPPPPPTPAPTPAPTSTTTVPVLRKLQRPRPASTHGDHHTTLGNFDAYCMHYLRIHNVTHQLNRQKLRESEMEYLRRQFNARKWYSTKTLRFRTHRS